MTGGLCDTKSAPQECDFGRDESVKFIISIPGKKPVAVGWRWLEERCRIWNESPICIKAKAKK